MGYQYLVFLWDLLKQYMYNDKYYFAIGLLTNTSQGFNMRILGCSSCKTHVTHLN